MSADLMRFVKLSFISLLYLGILWSDKKASFIKTKKVLEVFMIVYVDVILVIKITQNLLLLMMSFPGKCLVTFHRIGLPVLQEDI